MRLLLALGASLLFAHPAAAGSITSQADPYADPDRTVIRYTAGVGEANRLILHVTPAEVRFSDEAPLTAGAGCEQAGEREVVCRAGLGCRSSPRPSAMAPTGRRRPVCGRRSRAGRGPTS